MDSYIKLVKRTIEFYIKTGTVISPPASLPKEMLSRRAGVFVSIHKRLPHPSPPPIELKRKVRLEAGEIFDGIEPPSPIEELRGCIGTYIPTQENIAKEIIHNAIEAATSDPRFPPVTQEELPNLKISVDVLSRPELVMEKFISPSLTPIPYLLNPKVHGLIIESPDHRRALLLPDLPGVETVNQQISICRQKARIGRDEQITIYRFTVERHEEK